MMYATLRQWLVDRTALEPSLLEGAGFESMVAERIGTCGGTERAYIAHLDASPEEIDRLIAGIAVPETWLFRYPRSYEVLVDFARLLRSRGAPSISMMSVGCATGQEAYCMAMSALHAGWPAEQIVIDGIDRNQRFLGIASRAEYGGGSIRSEVPPWAMPFLHRRGDAIAIDPVVRSIVRFTAADATDSSAIRGGGPRDVIFCRNLLIYLNAPARERLLGSICETLVPGGLLFTGHAEQIVRGCASLRPMPEPHAFALARVAPDALSPPPPRVARDIASRPSVASAPPAVPRPRHIAAPPTAPIRTLDDARALADSGRAGDAEALIQSILKQGGPTAPAFELLGTLRMAQEDHLGARRCFEQAVYLDPHRATSLLQLAVIAERSGNKERAAALWGRARRAAELAEREART